ncbi:MAG: alpha/beta fold hydrolase [bacterium]
MSKLQAEFVSLDDIQVAYCQHGSGKALILLHGNSGSKAAFKKHQLESFADFHTFALDSRGHGQSRSHDTSLSISRIADDVIRFCQAMQIQQAYVVGYSDGGNIALFLAKKAPGLFPRLIAISPNYLVSGTTDSTLRTFNRIYKVLRFLDRAGLNMKKYVMRFDLMLTDIGISEEELRSIQTDFRILYAEADMVKEEHLVHLAGLIPGSILQKVPGCTHLSILSNPQAIAVMRSWLLEGE